MGALDVLGWAASACQVGGALWMASRPRRPHLPYVVMTPGALVWLVLALVRQDYALAWMMGTFTGINLFGIVRWAKVPKWVHTGDPTPRPSHYERPRR